MDYSTCRDIARSQNSSEIPIKESFKEKYTKEYRENNKSINSIVQIPLLFTLLSMVQRTVPSGLKPNTSTTVIFERFKL